MTKLSNLAQQVLNTLEPDLEKQEKCSSIMNFIHVPKAQKCFLFEK